MMIQAVLGNPHHPEYGVATISFPIPHDQYAHCMELLEALEIGDVIKADCQVQEINSFYSVLKRIEMLTVNAERPDTLGRAYELLQNLENYERIVEGTYGYGQQRLQETLGLDDAAVEMLDGYMDFEKYGEECMEADGVVTTEFGLLRRLEPPFAAHALQMRGMV